MNTFRFLAALLLAWPLAATAQTTPAPQQVTEVTEELDPATGKVIRRTTRTTTVPADAPATTKTATPAPTESAPATTATMPHAPARPAATASSPGPARARTTDDRVSDFFREKTTVASLNGPALLDVYERFIEKVREDRRGWRAADWSAAASVLSILDARYEQLRPSLSLDNKLTIRSQQGEFQALRTARQLSDQVSDKL